MTCFGARRPYRSGRLDATDLNVRQARHVLALAVVIAWGVRPNGERDVLGLDVEPSNRCALPSGSEAATGEE